MALLSPLEDGFTGTTRWAERALVKGRGHATPLHIGYNMLPYFKKLLWETTGQSFPEYSFLKPLEGPRKRGALGILFAVRPHP